MLIPSDLDSVVILVNGIYFDQLTGVDLWSMYEQEDATIHDFPFHQYEQGNRRKEDLLLLWIIADSKFPSGLDLKQVAYVSQPALRDDYLENFSRPFPKSVPQCPQNEWSTEKMLRSLIAYLEASFDELDIFSIETSQVE